MTHDKITDRITDQLSDPTGAMAEATISHLGELRDRFAERATTAGLVDVGYRTVDSPFGPLLVAATAVGVVRIAFDMEGHDAVLATLAERISPRIIRPTGGLGAASTLDDAARELTEYFDGRRQRFALPLDLRLTRGFRRSVVEHLPEIGYGRTASYAAIAAAVGHPAAVRAVGSACATNPLPVVIPCHRVVRSDGTIGAYLGGSDAKRALLSMEHASAEYRPAEAPARRAH